MNLNFQRKLDRIIGIPVCWFLSLFSRITAGSSKHTKPKKILVVLLSEMGSLLLAKPMFEYIKSEYGDTPVFVLVFEQNREFLEILDVVPPENIFTVSNASFMRFFTNSIQVITKFKKIKIDTVLDCELFSRISSIYSFLSGAKIRVGFHPHTQEGLFRGDFINRPVLYNPYHHMSQQFVTLAKAIESELVPKVKRPIKKKIFQVPSMEPSQEEVKKLWKSFGADFPQISGKKLVLLYPSGGLLPIRAWPLKNFCLIAEDFIQNGYLVGIIGMKEDKELANVILSYCHSKYCIDLTGYTKTVRELMLIFHFASLLITNDGGPGHFASLTYIPTIIFYGPETPSLYGPLDNKAYSFYVSLSCSPCLTAYNHRNSPCDGNNICLKLIDPEDVLLKAYELLEKQNDSRWNYPTD